MFYKYKAQKKARALPEPSFYKLIEITLQQKVVL